MADWEAKASSTTASIAANESGSLLSPVSIVLPGPLGCAVQAARRSAAETRNDMGSASQAAVPPNDAEALADAIQRISADSILARNLGRAGRLTVLEHFDGNKTAVELAALFTKELRQCK